MLVLGVCAVAAVLIGAAVTGFAAEETLPKGVLIGDADGIHTDAQGYYYIDARNLLPGDVIHKEITIQNLAADDSSRAGSIPYTISMTAQPLLSKGPADLLETRCTLKLDGKVIYEGSVKGDGTPNMNTAALELGSYAVGESHTLDVTLTVDPELELGGEKSEAEFRWCFYAHRSADEAPPDTGVWSNYGFLLPVAALLGLCVLLVSLKARRGKGK
jgi:hypothetical protein